MPRERAVEREFVDDEATAVRPDHEREAFVPGVAVLGQEDAGGVEVGATGVDFGQQGLGGGREVGGAPDGEGCVDDGADDEPLDFFERPHCTAC